ncbi:MAG: MBL fold metallo-hydrolase [Firmicutes bacterium]|nr:MBL fold metallo-hydrolase [Bacillota bacterium]
MATFRAADEVYGIDLFEEGRPGRSSAYLIRGREPILVETGSANSQEALWSGLAELGVGPEDLRHVVVTHVHLDHAGGAGQTMARATKALLHCHPRAARHLADPRRLEAGARAVYGERLDAMFGPILPVAADRIVVHEDESALKTRDRILRFYDTPGHAKHHTCVVDEATRGIFSGDTIGIRYVPSYTGWDFVYGFPTTTPSDFDPEVMLETLDRLEALNLRAVYHTHYGVTEPAREAFQFSRRGLRRIQQILPLLSDASTYEEVAEALGRQVREDLASQGHPGVDVAPLALDLMLNSQGILVYLQKRAQGPREGEKR